MPESTGTSGQPDRRRALPGHAAPPGPGPLAAIAAGGALGTLARYGLERAVVPAPFGVPWATLVVNVVGSFVLGAVLTLVVNRWPRDRYLRPLVAVGFCGGFTTFSTLAVEVNQRVQHGRAGLAVAYLGITLVVGLAAALGGMAGGGGRRGTPSVPSVDPDLLSGDEGGGSR